MRRFYVRSQGGLERPYRVHENPSASARTLLGPDPEPERQRKELHGVVGQISEYTPEKKGPLENG